MDTKTVLKTIQQVIDLCNVEAQNNFSGEATKEQVMSVILPDMESLMRLVETQQLPPQKERYVLSFANPFKVWGWNMQCPTKLYLALLTLNNYYKELR